VAKSPGPMHGWSSAGKYPKVESKKKQPKKPKANCGFHRSPFFRGTSMDAWSTMVEFELQTLENQNDGSRKKAKILPNTENTNSEIDRLVRG
jgi:hypothetical protein